jgi:endonuclease YncB( thermonuclease family)
MKGNVLYISGWLLAVASGFGLEHTSAASGRSTAEAGRVVRVLDGDTYEVLTGGQPVRVRLRGVDAPELSQPFGREAADSVTHLLRGQQVWLTRQGIDLYGRTLASLRVVTPARPGGVALDSLLVVRGWAWAWDPTRRVAGRVAEQVSAQRAGLGLWKCGVGGVVPPHVWRGFKAEIKRRYRGGCTW